MEASEELRLHLAAIEPNCAFILQEEGYSGSIRSLFVGPYAVRGYAGKNAIRDRDVRLLRTRFRHSYPGRRARRGPRHESACCYGRGVPSAVRSGRSEHGHETA